MKGFGRFFSFQLEILRKRSSREGIKRYIECLGINQQRQARSQSKTDKNDASNERKYFVAIFKPYK